MKVKDYYNPKANTIRVLDWINNGALIGLTGLLIFLFTVYVLDKNKNFSYIYIYFYLTGFSIILIIVSYFFSSHLTKKYIQSILENEKIVSSLSHEYGNLSLFLDKNKNEIAIVQNYTKKTELIFLNPEEIVADIKISKENVEKVVETHKNKSSRVVGGLVGGAIGATIGGIMSDKIVTRTVKHVKRIDLVLTHKKKRSINLSINFLDESSIPEKDIGKDNRYKKCIEFYNYISKNQKTASLKVNYEEEKKNSEKKAKIRKEQEKTNDGKMVLFKAVKYGNLSIIEDCILDNLDVNEKDRTGDTPLIIASQEGKMEIVEILIKNSADVNCKTKNGLTPLMLAARNGYTCIIEKLINYGADVNSKADGGETTLMFAAQKRDPRIVRLLIENGADVNAITSKGTTVLKAASVKNNSDVLKILRQHGATY